MWLEQLGEHFYAASPLVLDAVLAEIDLVATLVHVEQARVGHAVFGDVGLNLDHKLQRIGIPKGRGVYYRRSGGRRSCCKFAGRLGASGNCCGPCCLPPIVCTQPAAEFLMLWISSELNCGHRQLFIANPQKL